DVASPIPPSALLIPGEDSMRSGNLRPLAGPAQPVRLTSALTAQSPLIRMTLPPLSCAADQKIRAAAAIFHKKIAADHECPRPRQKVRAVLGFFLAVGSNNG